jgi:hypothetical protein
MHITLTPRHVYVSKLTYIRKTHIYVREKNSTTSTLTTQKIKDKHVYHSYTKTHICFKIDLDKKKTHIYVRERNPQPQH